MVLTAPQSVAMATREPLECITIAVGGFAPIGGVETLVHSLALALRTREISAEVICWGARSSMLADVEALGGTVRRNRFQWGCRWGAPDRLMMTLRRKQLRNAKLIVFPKLLRPDVHIAIKRMQRAAGNSKSVLITPYRPAEMWACRPPSAALLECFDTIITQSPVFESDLRSLGYKGRVSQLPYIPPPCNPAVLRPLHPLTIGFLGRLVADKRIDYLLEAISTIPDAPELRVHIFGDGPLKSALEAQAAALGLAARVTFYGAVEREGIEAAIDSCTLFAFTSRTEGQCLAAMEILSRGRPIVTTPVGLFPELLADGALGQLAPSDDPHRFGESILELASCVNNNPHFAPQAVQDKYASRFGFSAVLDGYLNLFQQMTPALQYQGNR